MDPFLLTMTPVTASVVFLLLGLAGWVGEEASLAPSPVVVPPVEVPVPLPRLPGWWAVDVPRPVLPPVVVPALSLMDWELLFRSWSAGLLARPLWSPPGFLLGLRLRWASFLRECSTFGSLGSVWALDPVHPRDFRGPFERRIHFHRTLMVVLLVALLSIIARHVGKVLLRHVLEPVRDGLGMLFPRTPVPKAIGTAKALSWGMVGLSRYHPALRQGGGYVPVTSSLVLGRLRRRARWVRVLEAGLGGRRGIVASLLRGRWTPDLPVDGGDPVLAYALGSVDEGVRVLGGGLVTGAAKPEGREDKLSVCDPDGFVTKPIVYLIVDTADEGPAVFVPELVAKLRLYSLFRKRDEQLLGALRTRAVEWCKALSLPTVVADVFVCDSVCWAYDVSTHEGLASQRVARSHNKLPVQTVSL